MRRTVFSVLFSIWIPLLAPASHAWADSLGLTAKVGFWRPDFDGTVTTSKVDVNDELGLDSDSGLYVAASLEHPIPLLPNIKVAHTSLKDSGNGSINRAFEFGGQTFDVNSAVSTQLDITHTDITLYYEFIDIGFDLDLGITARKFDGDLKIKSESVRASEPIDYWVPMGYLAARVGLPFFGFYVAGNINGVGYSDSRLIDYSLMGGWETTLIPTLDVGAELGYRHMSLKLDENDVGEFDSNVDVEGFFGNIVARF